MYINLVIFHPPCIDYNVSKEIISQYDFLKNAKYIFEKNNINLIYFYDLLPQEQAKKYYDIAENFKYTNDELIDIFYNVDLVYLKNKIDNEYNDAIIHYFESGQYLNIINKNKCIFSIYDPHSWNKLKNIKNFNIQNVEHHNINNHHILNRIDLILTSSAKYFYNINSEYTNKCEFIPFSYNANNLKIFEFQDFDNYFNRERKILMSGSFGVYTHRKVITCIKKNREQVYLQNNVINLEQIEEFSNIIQIMSYEKYNRTNTKYNEERGIRYLRTLSKYMGAFMCFGDFPLDFHLCKLWEIMLSGCLAFIEPKEMLKTDLGLIPYEHYVPMLIDENNKLIIDMNYYNKYLGTENGLKIAKQGFEFIRDNFTDEMVAEKYCEILKKKKFV